MALLDEAENAPLSNCIRMLVLGSPRVGKTCVVKRFVLNKFDDCYIPTIEDFHRKVYRVRGDYYKLDILDTSGTDPFPAMRRLSILSGDIFLIVYSIDNRDSFEEARRLREEVQNTIQHNAASCPKWKKCKLIPIMVCGNKLDLEKKRRIIDYAEAKHHFESLKSCGFMEVSAFENINIDELFIRLFNLARLPAEMAPTLHRKVNYSYVHDSHHRENHEEDYSGDERDTRKGVCATNSDASGSKRASTVRRKLPEAYGAYVPNAIRPNIQMDMAQLQIADNSEKFCRSNKPENAPKHSTAGVNNNNHVDKSDKADKDTSPHGKCDLM